ncbi:DEAD/DEAH box helicase [Algicella marina]|uniref:DEAD-box ATP-dependent RNA helicase RhpA n=1 Tax=Algicella marina TaxID=2683284 RepID=A0A6P1SVB5_9RHOB|nr:DEAD/DEAH box helicase [Algicella marina]
MTKFSDLDLDPKVLQAVAEAGYETPTPIQAQAIPHALVGRDVLGIAQTGTGKTASFTLPMITMLSKGRARARMPRSLVLAPTRELAAQVAENFEIYSKHTKLTMALLIGGTSFKDQDRLIDRGVDVLIATPGRLLDHFERGKLMLTGVQIMVVDEADRMLDMGFIPDIERIFKLTPFTRQTLFFSATMAPEITRITQEFLSNPERVEVARQATTSETIEQWICKHKPSRRDRSDSEKREVLRRLIAEEGDKLTNGIIFCNRKRDVDIVAKSLKKHGLDAAPIHGDLDQSVRTRTLDSFRDGSLRLLIASDVAARGLDIPAVSHVFNYDVPTHSEDYVHRIGRTGRAGRAGKAITLCLPHDEKYLEQIEELVSKKIDVKPSPLAATTVEADPAEGEETPKPAKSRSRSRSRSKPEVQEEAPPAQPEKQERRRSEGRRSGSRPGGQGSGVVGMGDHMPAFLMQSFSVSELMAATNREREVEPEESPPSETEPQAEAAPVDAPAEKPKRKRSPRKPKAKQEEPAETAQADVADEPASPEPDVAADAAPAEKADAVPEAEAEQPKKPARKPRKRASSKAAEKPSEPAPEVLAAETAPESPGTDAATDAEPQQPAPEATTAEAAAPAKPARKPRKRASAAAVIENITPDAAPE